MRLVQEVVLLADFRCCGCQKRLTDIIAGMNGETESVEVNVLEKKVTVTCRYQYARADKLPAGQVAVSCRKPVNRFALIARLFRSSGSRSQQ